MAGPVIVLRGDSEWNKFMQLHELAAMMPEFLRDQVLDVLATNYREMVERRVTHGEE